MAEQTQLSLAIVYVGDREVSGQGASYTVVEGRDPDGCPVLVAYPAPDQVPLRELPARIYAW